MSDTTKKPNDQISNADDTGAIETTKIDEETTLEAREGFSGEGESLWAIYKRRFSKHTLGKIGAIVLIILYGCAIFADFLAPYSMRWTDKYKSYHPPTRIYWTYENEEGKRVFRPWVFEKRIVNVAFKEYGVVPEYTLRAISIEPRVDINEMRAVIVDKNPAGRKIKLVREVASHYDLPTNHETMERLKAEIDALERNPAEDVLVRFRIGTTILDGKERPLEMYLVKGNKNFVSFFNEGIKYNFLGLFAARTHFVGSPTGGFFLTGTDQLGRDLLSRLVHGSRISLSVGIIGSSIIFIVGLLFGGIAGYFGGFVDNAMMRVSEVIMSFPSIYLLFTLRAVFPPSLTSIQVYILIIVILSFVSWARLGRIIRGMVLSIKTEDYVMSARTMGLGNLKIITRHILPNTFSFVIIQVTLSIPGFILGESALSLLGLGISEPQSSWGLMLSVARNYRVVKDFPWVLIPGFAIFVAIMAWNFFGDGIRDAMDPRSKH